MNNQSSRKLVLPFSAKCCVKITQPETLLEKENSLPAHGREFPCVLNSLSPRCERAAATRMPAPGAWSSSVMPRKAWAVFPPNGQKWDLRRCIESAVPNARASGKPIDKAPDKSAK
jgi:hypothetical protein